MAPLRVQLVPKAQEKFAEGTTEVDAKDMKVEVDDTGKVEGRVSRRSQVPIAPVVKLEAAAGGWEFDCLLA